MTTCTYCDREVFHNESGVPRCVACFRAYTQGVKDGHAEGWAERGVQREWLHKFVRTLSTFACAYDAVERGAETHTIQLGDLRRARELVGAFDSATTLEQVTAQDSGRVDWP